MGQWNPIPGLTATANTLLAEEWALLDWLSDHEPSHPDWEGVLEVLVANGARIDALGERKYK